jgi:LysM repeat protein
MAYTIQSGDTLSGIASKNKTTVQDLLKANPTIKDPNKIQAGQSLNLSPQLGANAIFPTSSNSTKTNLATTQTKPATQNNGLMGGLISNIGNTINAGFSNLGTTMFGDYIQKNLGPAPVLSNNNTTNNSNYAGGQNYTQTNLNKPQQTTNQTQAPTQPTYNDVQNALNANKGISDADRATIQAELNKRTASTTNGGTTPQQTPITPEVYSSDNPPSVGDISSTLANLKNNPSPQVEAARNALQDYQAKIANRNRQINTSGTWTGRALGQEQQFAQQDAATIASLQQALSNALTEQQQQIQALESAQSAVMPQQYGITTTPYNPATGTYGTMAGTQAGTGGLQGIGNIQGQIAVGQNVATLNSYLGGAQKVGEQLNQLITQNNLNPSDVQAINGIVQWLKSGVLSDPKYQELTGQINDFIASIAPILGAGGSVTDMKTQMSAALVNAQQSGGTITDVVNYFLDSAKQKIQGYQSGGGINTTNNQTNANTTGAKSWF